jgi:hypothetical protein
MANEQAAREDIKSDLLSRLQGLNSRQALFPQEETVLTDLVIQLEYLNPTPAPLQPNCLKMLVGEWRLIFASRGTVVTRNLAPLPDQLLESIAVQRIWQTLALADDGTLKAENGATFQLPWLGTWQLRAEGTWRWDEAEHTAQVSFNAFSVEPLNLFGQPGWQLPELRIPILESLRAEALWVTSYLDHDLRIGRGATGNRFVFGR